MTDAIYDFITMGVDFLVSAAMLSAIVVMLRGANIISQFNADQQATVSRVNYYKEYSLYDVTENLSAADVKSALMYYKNDLQIVIEYANNMYVYNDNQTGLMYCGNSFDTNVDTNITAEQFSDYIASDYTFNSWLYESYIPEGNTLSNSDSSDTAISINGYQGGVIIGIRFERDILRP